MTRSVMTIWKCMLLAAVVAALAGALPVRAADTFILSTDSAATLGSLSFQDEDLVEYDAATDTATVLFDGTTLFTNGATEDVNAVCVLPNGNIVLSNDYNATELGGLTFDRCDLVEYNPATDTATLFFDGYPKFGTWSDIDAVHVLANGHIILSTDVNATLGGLGFQDEDLVEYDPVAQTATLFFDGTTLFTDGGAEDVDAVCVLPNGHIILSTETDATLNGFAFEDEDLVEYDPVAGTATLFFDGSASLSPAGDVNAVHVPEPASLAVLGIGALGVLLRRRPRA
ncbi:MAG: PEP-CTERM sorting domain-containing protein [Planctomycetota bacterium]|nr:PEP-CTERM sorting domain-containing protein [Planctomycetota bacterium]